MKLNIRNIALVATMVSTVVVANAAGFSLRAGSGATLVGNTFMVTPGSGSFSVEIWYDSANHSGMVAGNNLALAFDRTNGSGTAAAKLDNILNVTAINGGYTLGGQTGANQFGFATRAAATTTGANNNYAFAGGATRPYVANQAVNLPTGVGAEIGGAGSFRVAVATVTYNLANGAAYGDDANEAGLFMSNQGDTATLQGGASGWVGFGTAPNGFKHAGSDKYAVAAVPEPTTMVAVVAGLAALARRRKK